MSVSLISNKKPRMTIEDLALEMREGFKRIDARIDGIEARLDKQDERMNKHWGIE